MVLIILTLPIYISKAYAADELTITKYEGKDGVEGFFRPGADIEEITFDMLNGLRP